MRLLLRFALGFVVGCVLSLWSIVLLGAGEGSPTPFVATAPMVLLFDFTKFGFWLVFFGIGFLWAIYFGGLPEINSLILRFVAMVLVGFVHFGSAAWMLSHDLNFDREYERLPILTVGYFVFLWVVIIALGLV